MFVRNCVHVLCGREQIDPNTTKADLALTSKDTNPYISPSRTLLSSVLIYLEKGVAVCVLSFGRQADPWVIEPCLAETVQTRDLHFVLLYFLSFAHLKLFVYDLLPF